MLASASLLERATDRLARVGWRSLLIVVALALVGGIVTAAWNPAADSPEPSSRACDSPPCFSLGTPAPSDLLVIVPTVGYLLVVLMGSPSLLIGARDILVGRRDVGGRRFLVFFGPLLVFIGMELVPHALSPCLFASVESNPLSVLCEPMEHDPAEVDLANRWHAIHHTVVGALPMTALYWRALRRWRPDVVRRREHSTSAGEARSSTPE